MKKNLKIGIIATAVFLLNTGNVVAESAGSGPNPYKDCGIGAALFPDTHWAAITSNVIWDAGTTAVTSATASPETCQGKSVEVAEFINRTYENLIEDTAKGEGEYLTAMLNIYGCNTSSQSSIISQLRNNVATGVSRSDYSSKTKLEKSEFFYNQTSLVIQKQDPSVCSA